MEFLNNLESTTEYDITIQGGLMFIELVGDTIYFGELLDNGTLFVKSIKPNGVVAILGEIQNSNSQPLNISLISASTYILLNINNKLFKISGNTISFLEEMCQTFIHDYRASYLPKIDTIYFGADDCQRRSLNGLELFKFNGTEISLVSEINPYQSGYHGYSALQCGGSLVFRGISPLYGRELFKLSIEDSCPTDPNKDSPGMCGCGIADLDLDNNGNTDCVNSTLIESVIEFPKDSQKFKLNAYRKGKKVFLELPKSDGAEYIYKYNLIKNGRKTRAKTIVKRSSKINIKKIPSNVHLHAKGGYLENGKKSKLSKTVKVL